jgi:hypothetical protein
MPIKELVFTKAAQVLVRTSLERSGRLGTESRSGSSSIAIGRVCRCGQTGRDIVVAMVDIVGIGLCRTLVLALGLGLLLARRVGNRCVVGGRRDGRSVGLFTPRCLRGWRKRYDGPCNCERVDSRRDESRRRMAKGELGHDGSERCIRRPLRLPRSPWAIFGRQSRVEKHLGRFQKGGRLLLLDTGSG